MPNIGPCSIFTKFEVYVAYHTYHTVFICMSVIRYNYMYRCLRLTLKLRPGDTELLLISPAGRAGQLELEDLCGLPDDSMGQLGWRILDAQGSGQAVHRHGVGGVRRSRLEPVLP